MKERVFGLSTSLVIYLITHKFIKITWSLGTIYRQSQPTRAFRRYNIPTNIFLTWSFFKKIILLYTVFNIHKNKYCSLYGFFINEKTKSLQIQSHFLKILLDLHYFYFPYNIASGRVVYLFLLLYSK